MEHLCDLSERSKVYLRQLKTAKKYEAQDKLHYGYITVTSAYLSVSSTFCWTKYSSTWQAPLVNPLHTGQ